ncbi:hypothetical protein [Actinomadura macra]|uniref:hypothetical protein n=1 Tax=Actinomadura macra TaxID=46164 RepID=UPI00083232BC|nr:hypothetical protein [Actinomadura macra]
MIRAATATPADALRWAVLTDRIAWAGRIGALRPGAEADIAVLEWEEGEFGYGDAAGGHRTTHRRLTPVATIRAGALHLT